MRHEGRVSRRHHRQRGQREIPPPSRLRREHRHRLLRRRRGGWQAHQRRKHRLGRRQRRRPCADGPGKPALAKAVYDRRTELRLSQAELAARTGLTQAKISRIEGSDTIPTLRLLAKLAKGLDASLNIAIDANDARVALTAHNAA
ncbi:helix-turn-helix domain-containing protein [Streptomyces sp. NPDC056165]|uniref:helix-turn-helix domain-containing protein n=1 Tax=Streptomyces sp. NPDC056165 TaxID=3345733 RepID=UPI0035D58628